MLITSPYYPARPLRARRSRISFGPNMGLGTPEADLYEVSSQNLRSGNPATSLHVNNAYRPSHNLASCQSVWQVGADSCSTPYVSISTERRKPSIIRSHFDVLATYLGRRDRRFYRVQLLDEYTHEGCECLRERYQKQPGIIVEYLRGLASDSAQETWPMDVARVAIHGL